MKTIYFFVFVLTMIMWTKPPKQHDTIELNMVQRSFWCCSDKEDLGNPCDEYNCSSVIFAATETKPDSYTCCNGKYMRTNKCGFCPLYFFYNNESLFITKSVNYDDLENDSCKDKSGKVTIYRKDNGVECF